MRTFDRAVQLLASDGGRQMLKATGLSAVVTAALMVEGWLLWTWLPAMNPGSMSWTNFDAVAAMLALPLIAATCFFRLPMGRNYVAPRYVIKPTQCAKAPSQVNPQVITSALNRALASWRTKARPAEARSLPTGASLSVPHVSLPLEWLWAVFRRMLTGVEDIVVEITLFDSEEPPRLVAWAAGFEFVTAYEIDGDGKFSITLDDAVNKIALDLFDKLDPVFRALIHWNSQNYDAAIGLFRQQPPVLARDLDLARLLMAKDRDDLAYEQLAAISSEHLLLLPTHRAAVRELEAELDIKVGNYAAARASLQTLLRNGRWTKPKRQGVFWTLLGDCDRDDGRAADALASYDQAESLALARLRRVLRLSIEVDLDSCLRRARVRPSAELDLLMDELHALFGSKASCLRLLGRDPSPQYEVQLGILQAKGELEGSQDWRYSMRAAQVMKYWANADVRSDRLDVAARRFDDAFRWYEQAIQLGSLIPAGVDDFGARTDLAWCECGKLLCRRALLALEHWPIVSGSSEDALRMCLLLADRLPTDDGARFSQLWSRARRPRVEDDSDGNEALAGAAILLARTVVGIADSSVVAGIVADLARFGASAATDIEEELLQLTFQDSGLPEAESTYDSTQRYGVFIGSIVVLQRVLQLPNEYVARLEDKLRLQENETSIRERCLEKFDALSESQHHEAEHAYGLACLYAVLSDCISYTDLEQIDDVVQFLSKAIKRSTGDSTRSGYIGRARTDPDFDHIRRHPDIRKLLDIA